MGTGRVEKLDGGVGCGYDAGQNVTLQVVQAMALLLSVGCVEAMAVAFGSCCGGSADSRSSSGSMLLGRGGWTRGIVVRWNFGEQVV